MRAVLLLTGKDLRRRLADPWAVLLSLAVPLVMAGMFALVAGGGSDGNRVPPLRLLVLDEEGENSPLAGILAGASRNPEARSHFDVRPVADREEGLRVMRDEGYAALLVLRKGLAEDLLEGKPVEVEILKNPSQSVMPIVAQQGAEVLALYLSAASRFLGEDARRIRRLFDGEGWEDSAGLAAMAAALYARVQAADDLLFPPLVEVERVKDRSSEGSSGAFNFLGWMYPGMMVMGLLFVSTTQMRDLLRERDAGTLKRLFASPAGAGQILVSKVLAAASVVAVCLAMMIALGTWTLGLRWGSPSALAALSALVVVASTGFAAVIYALVRTERQGDAFGGILIMIMSLLGGTFFPVQILPEWMRSVSLATVNHWSQEGFRVLASGGDWARLGRVPAVLGALGLGLTLLGTLLLRRRHLGGTL